MTLYKGRIILWFQYGKKHIQSLSYLQLFNVLLLSFCSRFNNLVIGLVRLEGEGCLLMPDLAIVSWKTDVHKNPYAPTRRWLGGISVLKSVFIERASALLQRTFTNCSLLFYFVLTQILLFFFCLLIFSSKFIFVQQSKDSFFLFT